MIDVERALRRYLVAGVAVGMLVTAAVVGVVAEDRPEHASATVDTAARRASSDAHTGTGSGRTAAGPGDDADGSNRDGPYRDGDVLVVPAPERPRSRTDGSGSRAREGAQRGEQARAGARTRGSGSDAAGTGGYTGRDDIDTGRGGGLRAPSDDPGGTPIDTGDGTTAAERFGWGTPNREDDFENGMGQWSLYDGVGHAGEGRRTPDAVSISDGVMTITGDEDGNTGGMAWNPGQKYGRWEARVKSPASADAYHSLLLLWPDAENFPVGGEIDFMEIGDPDRQSTDLFLHYGADNSQVHGNLDIDATEWHNWAVEWTPEGVTAYVDGEQWWRTTDTGILPPGPMHLCIQLDYFPGDGSADGGGLEHVDWVRQYSLDGDTGSARGRGDRTDG
ncbi:MAG: glycoside hydrolase family 16 protein [Pseudonocardia sp.]|nr:glycoside hydrolase family 16 protein [Pseudonocardia sp.]